MNRKKAACRNCGELTASRFRMCGWCRRVGRWGLFVGGFLGGAAYKLLDLWLR